MTRWACLLIPDLPVAAALRAEPELRGKPLGIVDRSAIVSGHLRGLTATQARATTPDLVLRPLSFEGVRSAQEALVDVALSVTPQVEDAGEGAAWLDLAGTEALFPTPRGLATALETRLAAVGLDSARLGMGPTRTTARLAARHSGGGHVVTAAEAQRFRAPLPIDLLDPPEELCDRLTRFGIRTLGDLVRLPLRSLGARLGEEGVALARRARGEDLVPFRPTPPKPRLEEGCDPDFGVANLETLAFLLRGPLERLAERLALRGLAARELYVELELESGAPYARSVGLRAPSVQVSVLAALVRLALEHDPPTEPVRRLRLFATPGSVAPAQLDLFLPPQPAPAELAVTVARLEALCGSGRVGTPGAPDGWRPEASCVGDFDPDGAAFEAGAELPSPTVALRALRPPWPIRVFGQVGTPERVESQAARSAARSEPQASEVRGAGFARAVELGMGHVVHCAGPWRLFGEWWGEAPFARDYFDVELEGGGLFRIYRNLDDESWWVDGMYD